MNDDYLCDKSGDPDPEIERLEGLLAPLAYRPSRQFRQPRRHWPIAIGIAAAVTVVAGAAWIWLASRPSGPSWQVVALNGPQKQRVFSRGGTLDTDASSRLRLDLESFGHVELEPNTRLKLLVTKQDEQRMSLAHGKIHALIWAPPGQFYVNTPSSVTIDLGCSYTLEVNEKSGDGTLRVDYGWVAFEDHGKESFIPAHAVCITRPSRGPGIPYYEDAAPSLQSAVDQFDTTGDLQTVQTILAAARERDALTVWHLLRRVPAQERGMVFDRLPQLIEVPGKIGRDRVLTGDPKAYDELWDALGLGDTKWWRMWKR